MNCVPVENSLYLFRQTGIEQANNIGRKLLKELKSKEFVMYSSDLLRAKHTAEIVGSYLEIEPILRTELRERNLGKCVGKSVLISVYGGI